LNSLPKYVVSSTLEEPKWTNATVLRGEVVSEVSKLKRQTQGEIVVYASRPLVRTLMEHDLVDELRLTVFQLRTRSPRLQPVCPPGPGRASGGRRRCAL